ncbi:MAG TPA: hypothetical protein VF338_12910 [Leptolinea sp.]
MKKPIYALLILIMLTLSACAGQAPVAQTGTGQSNDQLVSFTKSAAASTQAGVTGIGLNTDFENAEPVITQLILGIIKLDGTDQALIKAQAASMLTLWDEYQTAIQKMMPSGGQGGKPGDTPKVSGTPAASGTPAVPTVDIELQTQLDSLTTRMQAVLTAEQISAIQK